MNPQKTSKRILRYWPIALLLCLYATAIIILMINGLSFFEALRATYVFDSSYSTRGTFAGTGIIGLGICLLILLGIVVIALVKRNKK